MTSPLDLMRQIVSESPAVEHLRQVARVNPAVELLREIVGDGFLSESKAARAQELLRMLDAETVDVPEGPWREDLVAIRYVDGLGWRPSPRGRDDAVYCASDVHRVLKDLLPGSKHVQKD